MITKIKGKLLALAGDVLTLEVGAFEYQVYIAEFSRRQLQTKIGQDISLHTIEYLEGNPMQGRLTPRLIGFLNEAEREFFEMFCSVDGVGVKKALRSMVRPVPEVAAAIENQDTKQLAGLPGIGPATSERIVAKLRRKMPKFALLVPSDVPDAAGADRTIVEDTFEVLRTLGHSEADARRLIDEALAGKRKFKDTEGLLSIIYDRTLKD